MHGFIPMRAVLAVAFSFLVVAGRAGSIRADEESDRRSLVAQIDSKLDAAASKLAGIDRKSDARDIDDAQGYVSEVERLIEGLKRVKGNDSNADRIVSNYPGYVRDFRGASDALKALKLRQPKAEDYVRQCKAFDAEMTARANSAKDDPRGAEELSEFARSMGRKGEELMSDAERQRADVERSRDEAKRFGASEGRWSNVRSSLTSAADDIARAWRDNYDRAKSACEEVVKRERHREVERVLAKLANTRTGRADLRRKIDELLVAIADRVKNVESQSDGSGLRNAGDLAKDLESQLERLRGAAGDDPESRRIASTWPSWVRELRESLESMSELKFNQRRADGTDDKCEAKEKALLEQARRYVADPTLHERAMKELAEEAAQVGNPIKAGADNAIEFDQQMEKWSNKARAFNQSEGPWGRIAANLRDSADRTLAYWRDRLERMKRACANIMRGTDHPAVRSALEEMSRGATSASASYRALRDEFNRWKAEVDKLREFTKQDVEEIRRELCAMPDAEDVASVNAVADRWKSQLNPMYDALKAAGDRIKRQADDLIAKRRALKSAPKVKEAVDAILASIEKIKDGQLKGSNDPRLLAYIRYGQDTHRSLQSSCDAKEITISGSYCDNPNPRHRDCRLDCVKGCTIVEIKPKESKDKGLDQARAYAIGLRKMFTIQAHRMFEGPFAIFKTCVHPDGRSLDVTPDVKLYDFCPSVAELSPTLERVDRIVPSESE